MTSRVGILLRGCQSKGNAHRRWATSWGPWSGAESVRASAAWSGRAVGRWVGKEGRERPAVKDGHGDPTKTYRGYSCGLLGGGLRRRLGRDELWEGSWEGGMNSKADATVTRANRKAQCNGAEDAIT